MALGKRWTSRALVAVTVGAVLALGSVQSEPADAALPAGFQESIVFSGLDHPTTLRFAPDGRVFVAEKSGVIKVFDGLADTTPTVFADLSTNVHNFWDRGMLGLELDPNFATQPYVYVLYTYDHVLGSGTPAPRWGTPGVLSDPCPNPPGATGDGCVVSGRLSRLDASGPVMTGSEQVLVEDWCQQYPSHSTGGLAFGADGALYASAGDGASFAFVDYGQDGDPLNPCGDPPGGSGSVLTPPTAEGGALRAQDLRTNGDPVSLDGTIVRVDRATGEGHPGNPFAASSDANTRRIIAYGLRNPFRLSLRPGTNEIWTGDVGWGSWEEINRIVDPGGSVENFGWPCYEGTPRELGYDSANLDLCEDLYRDSGAVTDPFFAYHHENRVVPNETCPTGTSSISGLAFEFYQGGPYPASFDGALFFADYSRDCIWVIKKDANGIPAPGLIETFVTPAANPVDLQMSPAGELFYVDFDLGSVRRIQFGSTPPPSSYSGAVLADTPAGYWRLGEPSGTVVTDTSGAGRSGAFVGNPTLGVPGALSSDTNTAVGFNGTTQYGQVPYAAALNAPQFSVEAWAYVTGGQGTFRSVVTSRDSSASTTRGYVLYAAADGTWQFWIGAGGAGAWQQVFGPAVALNTWTHLVGTYDGTTAQLYVNGTLVAAAQTTLSANTVRPLRFAAGATEGNASFHFPGRVDEVAVYGSALQPSRVQSHFAAATQAGGNQPPIAVASASPTSGQVPLTVTFNGSGSSDPDGSISNYSWDLDGDGAFDDGSGATPSFTYTVTGTYTARLRVTDNGGASSVSTGVTIAAGGGNTPPAPTIAQPGSTLTWKVGDTVSFSGSATDPNDGNLPASALSWSLILHHCPSGCHTHALQTFSGVASGSFPAPDHEYPSHLELRLTATDTGGLTGTTSVLLQPQTVVLTFNSAPSGLQLVLNGAGSATPFTRTVIAGSNNSLSAPTPQSLSGADWGFFSWSDSGGQTHNVVANTATTYTATYSASPRNTGPPTVSGPVQIGKAIKASTGAWTGSTPLTFSYQWRRCDGAGAACVDIPGAAANSYTISSADADRTLRVSVTATNSVGSASATSAQTAVVRQRR